VLRHQPDTIARPKLDGGRKAIKAMPPTVDRGAGAGTVLVDQLIDEIDAKPLHQAEASAGPDRNSFD
jgi:hypothetical protein